MSVIGNFLKETRKDKNIKVVTLAKQVGISQPYISNIENGKRGVTKELFFKIIYAIAELSPITRNVYDELGLSEEKKEEIDIDDTLGEFWDEYYDDIKQDLNSDMDDDEKPILTLEDFLDYVQSWSFEDMLTISGYSDFLDSKYGVDNYMEYVDYQDYSSYTNPEYVQELVFDYWYQSILSDFLELFEIDLSPIETKIETNWALLNELDKQEFEIYSTVKSLRSKSGYFARYHLQDENKEKLVDLNILYDQESIYNVTFDGKPLSEEDIIALRNTLNGIRYSK
ncbi:helix-turn-helix domain-containing protein [Streptococcus thermophilus]|nr:helix-turn-helix domain-containing protein [Streptococcus thermophilus]MCE2225321.1 helix-turn-helix domain-containing protein [Streptococcus thermophilus]MCE2231452.1 helix-turn-helix domain-containing protein [Streptococcus thermophilus]MCE2233143.1 helix-turn-helix domain-containing protein [Streptococcus thermophilus]MCE2236068.1 helix-turn-helix domain-containing protein [Streptococcus thermophilus]